MWAFVYETCINLCAVNTAFLLLLYLHMIWFPTFFHSQTFPFTLFSAVFTRSFRSRTVMAHHKSHFSQCRLNNGLGIFDQSIVLQLSPPVSYVLFYCMKNESYDLQDIKIEWSKFKYSSWGHPKYRSDELRPKYHQRRKVGSGEPFNKCLQLNSLSSKDWRRLERTSETEDG